MYFDKGLQNIGIVLKGSSVLSLPKIADKFEDCFIVNNIDKNKNNKDSEYSFISPLVKGKNIVHFVNRLKTAPLLEEHYKELGIRHVQLPKSEIDDKLKEMKKIYSGMGLQTHLLPEEAFKYNHHFDNKFYLSPKDSNYRTKHPNTGVLCVVFACVVLQPKNIWIAGLDFYESDYLYRRPWHNTLKKQQTKMQNTDMKNHFIKVVEDNSDVKFHVATNSSFDKVPSNMEIVR